MAAIENSPRISYISVANPAQHTQERLQLRPKHPNPTCMTQHSQTDLLPYTQVFRGMVVPKSHLLSNQHQSQSPFCWSSSWKWTLNIAQHFNRRFTLNQTSEPLSKCTKQKYLIPKAIPGRRLSAGLSGRNVVNNEPMKLARHTVSNSREKKNKWNMLLPSN